MLLLSFVPKQFSFMAPVHMLAFSLLQNYVRRLQASERAWSEQGTCSMKWPQIDFSAAAAAAVIAPSNLGLCAVCIGGMKQAKDRSLCTYV